MLGNCVLDVPAARPVADVRGTEACAITSALHGMQQLKGAAHMSRPFLVSGRSSAVDATAVDAISASGDHRRIDTVHPEAE